MRLTHKLDGFDQMEKLLKELPRGVENSVLQSATISAMRDARKSIMKAAPRHLDAQSPASKKYGSLHKNIRLMRLKRVQKGQKGARITTGNAFWGFIYELGSRFQPARPWFAPAFRNMQGVIINTLGRKIGEGIEKNAGKYKGGRR